MSKKSVRWSEQQYSNYLLKTNQPKPVETVQKKAKVKVDNRSDKYGVILFPVLTENYLPIPKKEYHFHDKRQWRFDFAWPEKKVALEVQGGIYTKEVGHSSTGGMLKDMNKFSEAACLGWRILLVPPDKLTDEVNIKRIRKALYYGLQK